MKLPDGTAPTKETPIEAVEVARILNQLSGGGFAAKDIRITPAGFSSAMNGAAYVNTGGDPDNAYTWKYTMVFNVDGKLSYYMKGRP